MRISEIATATHCHPETVRYYQKVGLLRASNRDANGYGRYTQEHLANLRLLRRAKSLGFSQAEMRELVALSEAEHESCERVRELTQKQLTSLEEKITQLSQIQAALRQLEEACENNTLNTCPALAEMLSFDEFV